jgi:death-on-curing protein
MITKSSVAGLQNNSVQFLSVDEVLAIHERLIVRFGGSAGVRDQGLLESALYRPQTGYYEDLASMAAALFESLLLNHAFIDGNKRVAFFATDVFLRLNSWKLSVDGIEAHRFLIANLEAGTCNYQNLQTWIREILVKI